LNQLGNLLHGEEQFVSADAGYQGAPQREELAEVDVDWLIAERGYMNIDELANLLDVSTQTVRRDIRKLSEQGLITRHHG
ncbi:DeoR family transcriptional regulator, partial [Escherichia coli]|uniref:DeoR family transcriptional regulator n=1 Tax=Escherichia coli TaxID=562 RepID=UPI00201E9FF3